MSNQVAADDAPFIIWTLQRTGGTNLAQTLFDRSPFRGVQHEPFNVERLFGSVTQRYIDDEDEAILRNSVAKILDERVLMKHCVEKVPGTLNRVLAESATHASYRHVFLYRRQALGRLLSYHFAMVSGVWGKEDADSKGVDERIFSEPIPVARLLQHERRCRGALKESFEAALEAGGSPAAIAFEDIYGDQDVAAGQRLLKNLLQDLHLARPDEDDSLLDKLRHVGAQGTRGSYLRFSNYDKFKEAVAGLGDFDLVAPESN